MMGSPNVISWAVSQTWEGLIIVGVLILVSVAVFWLSFRGYQRHFSSQRALKLALLHTTGWMLVYGGSFVLILGLVSQQLAAGWLRFLVAGLIWWLLAQAMLAPAWRFLDRMFETW